MQFMKALAGAALSAGLLVASAGAASADHESFPPPKVTGSCVAVFVQGFAGPPGQFQRFAKAPMFGREQVSAVARLPKEACRF